MKRLLSFILTIVMIVGILPSVSFASAVLPDVKNPVYLLTSGAFDTTGSYLMNTGRKELNRRKSTGFYEYVNHLGLDSIALGDDALMAWNDEASEFGNCALILKMTIDEPGRYNANIAYFRYAYSGKLGIYLIPKTYADTVWDMKTITSISPILADEKTVRLVEGLDTHTEAGSEGFYTSGDIDITEKEYYALITVDKSDYATIDFTNKNPDLGRYYCAVSCISLNQKKELTGNEEYLTYNFTAAGRPDVTSGTSWLENKNGVWNSGYADFPQSPADPGQRWAYAGTGVGVAVSSANFVNFGNYVATNKQNNDEWTAFRIKVPADGMYRLSAGTAYKYKNAAKDLRMYLVPADENIKQMFAQGNTETYGATSDANGNGVYVRSGHKSFSQLGISNDYLIGMTSLFAPKDSSGEAMGLGAKNIVELDKNTEYMLILHSPVAGVHSISSLTFEYVPIILELEEISASFGENNSVLIGSKLSPTVSWRSNGEEIELGTKTVGLEILENEDGVLIEGENGQVYAAKTGNARVRVLGTLNGVTKKYDVNVNVYEDNSYSGTNQSYLFHSGAYSDTVTASFSGGTHEANFIEACPVQDYGDIRPWAIVSAQAPRPNGNGVYFHQTASYLDLSGNAGDWVAFKVKVPRSGKYDVDLTGYTYKSGGLAEIYMIPYEGKMTYADITANIDTYASEGTLVAEVDLSGTEDAPVRYPKAGMFFADASLDYSKKYAEYLMVIKTCRSKLNPAGQAVLIHSLHLMGGAGIKTVDVKLTDTALGIGENTSVTDVVAKNATGDEVDLSDSYVAHYLPEESKSILEISEDGKTFTAIGEGKAKINTVVLKEGSAVTVENEITVDDNQRITNAYLYSASIASVGETLAFTTRVELKNRRVVKLGEIIGFEIVSQSTDGVVELSLDGKSVRATGVGSAEVKAKLSARGKVYETDAVEVTVNAVDVDYPANFDIDFRIGAYSGDSYSTLDEILSYSYFRNWVFHKWTGADPASKTINLALKDGIYAVVDWADVKPENYLALRVMFPKSGKYTVDVTGLVRFRAAKIDMFVVPKTGENEANLESLLVNDGEYYSSSCDFYNETEESGITRSFGTVNIDSAGEYFIVLRIAEGRAYELNKLSGDVWYPLYITFTNETAMTRAELVSENGRTEIEPNETLSLIPKLYIENGDEIDYDLEDFDRLTFESSDESIATVSPEGVITGVNEGKATVTATVTYEGITRDASFEVTVIDFSGIDKNYDITVSYDKSIYVYGATRVELSVKMNSGRFVKIPYQYVSWNIETGADAANISDDGTVTGMAVGKVVIQPSVSPEYKDGIEDLYIPTVEVDVVWDTTINPAIFTLEERENVKKNVSRYSWARDEVRNITTRADNYLDSIDRLYNMMIPEGVPRWYHVGHTYDPLKFYCRYCGCNIGSKYGSYGWSVNALTREWKIQCPDCKRLFPSNDFKGFYELGLADNGSWDYSRALTKHHELFVCKNGEACECTSKPHPLDDRMTDEWKEFYGFGKGYLKNEMYSEMDKKLNTVGWGVDDGYGYMQPYVSDPDLPGYDPRYYDNGDGYAWYRDGAKEGPVMHTYVAYYVHGGIWYGGATTGIIQDAVDVLSMAFVYTGDAKYGRAGAILLDGVADVYPDFDWYRWSKWRGDTGAGYRGNVSDAVWSAWVAKVFANAYDALLPIYNDPYIVEYLSKNGARYEEDDNGNWIRDKNGDPIVGENSNLKDSPGALRKNVEDNILIQIYEDVRRGKIWGNFGMHQSAVATAALALNRLPETGEMIDWIMRNGTGYNTGPEREELIEGGYVLQTLVEVIDRDGHGNENAASYNRTWVENTFIVAELLAECKIYPSANLYNNPKLIKMLLAQPRLTLGGYYCAQMGDSLAFASTGMILSENPCINAFKRTGNREVARALYKTNGNTSEGLRGSIYDAEPEKIAEEIEKIVAEDGNFQLPSDMMTGFGFAALRAGAWYESASSLLETNTNRDIAIYFGANTGHGHLDTMNLFMSAFGLNVAPDIGYPEQTGDQPNRFEWVEATISHNTVIVDEKDQRQSTVAGTPHHFDDSGRVKLMDISAERYAQTEEYRRTVFMVEVDDENSYGVDFFHVLGGDDHLYSFHSQSDELTDISGLSDKVETPMYTDEKGNLYGTYAGKDVKYGADPGGLNTPVYPRGSTWLKNVRTFNGIEDEFTVEFNVKDWRKVLRKNRDIRLRLTMLNDEPLSEVTFATALPPQTGENKGIGEIDYLLVRNKGSNLDTTFTAVLEPYDAQNKFIESIEKVSMVRKEGEKPGYADSYSAVKVTLKNGRVDYIIYSTNNDVNYIVDGKINFRGFGGVLSLEKVDNEEAVIYSYLHDGEVLELIKAPKEKAIAAYTGTVKDFTQKLEMQNSILYTPSEGETVDTEALEGKFVYVDNDGAQNAVYKIKSAEESGSDIVLNIGDVTPIRSYIDADDIELGYVYNISKDQSLRIPITGTYDASPKFGVVDDYTVTAGSKITIPLDVYSEFGKNVILVGTTLPRGMTIDQKNQNLTWKPDSSQIGENHIAITASDGILETTRHFTVTVYGSTTSKPGADNDSTDSTDTTDTPSGSGGGGGDGGATPAPDEGDNTDDDTDVPSEKFTDLESYTWAEDAINELAESGIIKGTSDSTFSPANNITRADFALLLVRAFGLTSDNTENFADVDASDYFARELAIARNCGIVGGIGDNKYAPRNTITRQDMMVIVYRALQNLSLPFVGKEDCSTVDEMLAEYPDFNDVAPYAKDAVSFLVSAGLVNGKSGLIAPKAYTTRAEVAVLLKRILDFANKN